jgi:sugar lactone lactonase YvrE
MIVKTIFVVLIVSVFMIALSGCKKERPAIVGTPQPDPGPHEKKWQVTTIAGSGISLFLDGPALSARFRLPFDVVVDTDGTIYIADGLNHRIRKLSGGIVTTFVGGGMQDTTNGFGVFAGYSIPSRLALDQFGNLFSLDVLDARVRKISPLALVSTVAGNVATGFADGPANFSRFNRSFGIMTDATGNIFIGDTENRRIRKITANGQVLTIAGNGVAGFVDGPANSAEFFNPQGVVLDADGNLFVADQNRIRKITPTGIVSTFAGNDSIGFLDGQGNQARFALIEDIVIDEQGNIYATDENRIRKITPQADVTTIAGSTEGFGDGEGLVAKFSGALGLGIDKQGKIYVADANNARIRKISFE